VAEGITDVFKVAGLKNPDISIMSDQFLAEVAKIPQKNLAVELLQRLIKDELKTKFKTNIVKQKRFSELLTASLNKYSNRAVEAAQVIAELIEMAKKFREELERGVALGLTNAEQSFYDALADNPSAQELMKEEVLATIARELAETLRNNVTIDWQNRESVRARLRLLIRTKLRRYKYPPDQQENAIDLVLQQAEVLGEELVKET
jgi:type I restriction enzyme R subunit